MILERKGDATQIGGALSAPQGFKIASSKIAFIILSSGIYNDKIRAVIRELSCNAFDAHVAAGKKDEPFEVHLPTAFEPWFAVKDNGIGLSHNEVMNLYCTYFESNKSDSNDYIGAMGLGSKSPFAYLCQQNPDGTYSSGGFSVISRYQGMTRVYSAQISEAGTPDIVLLSEEKTPNAGNGLEVSFPVKQSDISEFENKARVVFEFFTPTPKFNKNINVNKQEYVLRTDKWALRGNSYYINGLRAVQGNVQYAVGEIDESRMNENQQRIADLPLDIFFNIGDLAVAASRESLQLDEATIANILKALDTVYTEMLEEVKKKLDTANSLWEARIQIYNLISRGGAIGKIVNDAQNRGLLTGTYKNFTMAENVPTINMLDYDAVQVSELRRSSRWNSRRCRKEFVFGIGGTDRERALAEVSINPDKQKKYNYTFRVDDDMMFIINDLKGNGEKYASYVVRNQGKKVFFITRQNRLIELDKVVEQGLKMMEGLGGAPVTLTSELKQKYAHEVETPRSYYRGSGERRPRRIVSQMVEDEPCVSRGQGWTKLWEVASEENLDAEGTKYYVVLQNNSDAQADTNFYSAASFHRFVSQIRNAGFPEFTSETPVFGLKPDSKLIGTPEWKPFLPAVWEALRNYMTPERETNRFNRDNLDFNCPWDFVLKTIAEDKSLAADSPMQQFADLLYDTRNGIDSYRNNSLEAVIDMAERRGEYTPKVTPTPIDFDGLWEGIKEKYPMLKISDRFRYTSGTIEETTVLTAYFKLVDESSKTIEKEMVANA